MNVKHRIFSILSVACVAFVSASVAAAQSNSASPAVHQDYQRALQDLKQKQPALAAQELRQVLRLDPRNLDALANLGVIDYMAADYRDAARQFRKALAVKPALWKVQAMLGMCDARLGRLRESARLFNSSFPHLRDKRLQMQVGMDLLGMDYRSGHLLQATSVIKRLIRIDPTSTEVLYAAYRTYSQLAARALNEMALFAPRSGRLHQALAEHLAADGNFQAAIRQYRQAIASDPNLPGLHDELGEAILQGSHSAASRAQAEKEFKAALQTDPHNARPLCRLGKIYLKESNLPQALKTYSQALRVAPGNVQAEIGMGSVLAATGILNKAASYLRAAVRQAPLDPAAHYQLALLDHRLGLQSNSAQQMRTFRRLDQARKQIRSTLQQSQ